MDVLKDAVVLHLRATEIFFPFFHTASNSVWIMFAEFDFHLKKI